MGKVDHKSAGQVNGSLPPARKSGRTGRAETLTRLVLTVRRGVGCLARSSSGLKRQSGAR
jgi:hypothetical protein